VAKDALHDLQVHKVELEAQNQELRRSQFALEEARARYLDLYESAPVGYFTLSESGAIQEVNLTGAALLRQERSDLVGRPFATLLDPGHANGWHLQFRSLTRTRGRHSFRVGLRRSDGSALPCRVACEGVPGSGGKVLIRVVVTDISEQANVEKALRESQERLSAVLDEFHDGYWHWSAEGGQTVYSGRLGTMLGIAADGEGGELPFDMSWVKRIHGDDLPTARLTTEDLLHGRRDRFDVEFRWHMPDGSGKWVRARGRVVRRDGRGKATRMTGTLSDISENKHLRECLRRLGGHDKESGETVRN
jgi:PAS domain S-box-containing protein